MKKILVTGSAGFIGYHLTKRLLERGDSVIGIDNINDYYDINLKYARLTELGIESNASNWGEETQSSKYINFRFIRLNLEDQEQISRLFEKEKFDIVCNLAAQAGVRYSIENPHAYISSNVLGFLNILEACKHNEIKHLVYASSSSVYGNNNNMPLKTSYTVDNPISLYAATKKSNELMAHVYSHLYNIPTTGLRFFTVYGPWGRPDMAPFLFTNAIEKGKPIKVFNHGDMYRDFTYIDDIIEGVKRVIDSPPIISNVEQVSEVPYKIYNIGNSQSVSLERFISLIEENLNRNAIKDFQSMQPGDVWRTEADVSDLMKDIGYMPSTHIEEGVSRFVKWYMGYYNI